MRFTRIGILPLLGIALVVLLVLSVAPVLAAPVVETTIGVPAGPQGAAVNATTQRCYVTMPGLGSVGVIDTSTNAYLTTIDSVCDNDGIAVNPTNNRIYCANWNGNDITVIDGTNYTNVDFVPSSGNPYRLAVNTVTNKVYVTNNSGGFVTVIDASNNSWTIPGIASPLNVCVNSAANMVYVTRPGQVIAINGATDTIAATYNIPGNPGCNAIAGDWTYNRLYIACSTGQACVMNAADGSFVSWIAAGGAYGADVNQAAHRVYFSNSATDNVTVADTTTGTIVTTVAVGDNPWFVSCNQDSYKTYVANLSSSTVSVISDTPQYTISVSANPAGGGSVSGGGTFDSGATVNLHASANAGYHFINWTEGGSQVSTNADYSFTATANRTLVANFGFQVTLIADDEGGSVSGGGTFVAGSTVTVHGNPIPGCHFLGWWDPALGTVSYDADYSFTATVDRTLHASFGYEIQTSADPLAGGFTLGGGFWAYEQVGLVRAVANAGYRFVNWTEGGSEVSTDAIYSFTATADRTLVANFVQTYTISASADPAGGGSVSGGGTFDSGATVNMHAGANPGYHFIDWTEGGSQVSTNADYSFAATANRTLVANFEINTYTIAASAHPLAGGSITGAGDYTHGQTVDLHASPNAGYAFLNWTEGGSEVATDPYYSFTATGNRTLVANFDYADPFITNLSPNHGRAGHTVQLIGLNFDTGGTVWFGTLASPSTTWLPTAVYAVVPPGLTTGMVQLTYVTVHGKTSNPVDFTVDPYLVDASVQGGHGTVAPAHQEKSWGDSASIDLSPENGYDVASITDNGTPRPISDPYLIADIQADHAVVVTYAKTVTAPIVDSVDPATAEPGEQFVVTGENFGAAQGDSYLTVNGTRAQIVSWSDTRIVATIPEGASSGSVEVFTAKGGSNTDKTVTIVTPTWYLAEGTTAWGFSTYITIENPNTSAVKARITYMDPNSGTGSGRVFPPRTVELPPLSQTTVDPAWDLGNTDFSTKVECLDAQTIAVDRTMTWTGEGAPCAEAHNSVGVTSPAATWFLPEGSSDWGFETWTLVQNPNATNANLTLTYMTGEGAKVVQKKVEAYSRASFDMLQDIGADDASIEISSDVPVIAERSQYRNDRREGSCSVGAAAASQDFFLAEGTTAWGFSTYVLVQNPNDQQATVNLTYMTPVGPVDQAPFTMPPDSRKTVRVNDVAGVENTDLSTMVHADRPVIAERAMYWNGGPDSAEVCHDSIGLAGPHMAFMLPDGQTTGGWETWTLVANPNPASVIVEINYLPQNGDEVVTFNAEIPANSRSSFNMAGARVFPGYRGRAAILVCSLDAGRPVLVERAMYKDAKGCGTDTVGAFAD